jgi:hypothetical protein
MFRPEAAALFRNRKNICPETEFKFLTPQLRLSIPASAAPVFGDSSQPGNLDFLMVGFQGRRSVPLGCMNCALSTKPLRFSIKQVAAVNQRGFAPLAILNSLKRHQLADLFPETLLWFNFTRFCFSACTTGQPANRRQCCRLTTRVYKGEFER